MGQKTFWLYLPYLRWTEAIVMPPFSLLPKFQLQTLWDRALWTVLTGQKAGASRDMFLPLGVVDPARMEPSWLSPPCTRDPLTPAPIHFLLNFSYLILFMWNMKMVLKVRGAQNCTLRESDSTSLFYPISIPPFFPCLVFWSPFKHLCCKRFTHTSNGR